MCVNAAADDTGTNSMKRPTIVRVSAYFKVSGYGETNQMPAAYKDNPKGCRAKIDDSYGVTISEVGMVATRDL